MTATPPDFAPHEFRKSSYSGDNDNNCVMIARRNGWTAVRDSKSGPYGPRLTFPGRAFGQVLANPARK